MAGAAPSRGFRSSQLLLGWRSRDLTLDAYTGQPGVLVASVGATDLPGLVEGRNGASARVGHAMPRWEQVASQGNIPRFLLDQTTGLQDVETFNWPLLIPVMAISLFFRIWPGYAAGSNVAGTRWVGLLGNDANAGGGYLGVHRTGLNWLAVRARGSSISSAVADAALATWPMELLVTLAAVGTTGTVQLQTRDAAGVVTVGPTQAAANTVIPTEFWGNQGLFLATTGKFSYEEVKVARNVWTFPQMDLLH